MSGFLLKWTTISSASFLLSLGAIAERPLSADFVEKVACRDDSLPNGSEAIVPIWIQLFASGQYGRADFSDTASFNFTDIPTRASFTSASGSFLTGGAVPEPSTWAMALLGFAGLGYMALLRRKTVTAAGLD